MFAVEYVYFAHGKIRPIDGFVKENGLFPFESGVFWECPEIGRVKLAKRGHIVKTRPASTLKIARSSGPAVLPRFVWRSYHAWRTCDASRATATLLRPTLSPAAEPHAPKDTKMYDFHYSGRT